MQMDATNQNVPLIIDRTQINQQMNPNQQPPHPGIAQANPQTFPVRTLKVLGGIQIGLGILLGILSLIAVILDAIAMHVYCHDNYDNSNNWSNSDYWSCMRMRRWKNTMFGFDVTCLVCSGWYIMTGFLPLCMSRKRESSWRGLRIGFMVCSIVGASIFVPTMFSLGVIGSIYRSHYDTHLVVLSAFLAVLSFVELVVAIIAAAYCCCCTPWTTANQPVQFIVMNGAQPGMILNLQETQIPMMNYQPNVMMPSGQAPSPSGQQYVVTTNQPVPQHQQYVVTTNQPVPQHLPMDMQQGGAIQPQMVRPEDPPCYKE